jgi:hypothetical protein
MTINTLIKHIILGAAISTGIGYSISSGGEDFIKKSIISGIGYFFGYCYFSNKKNKDEKIQSLEELLEQKKADQRVEILETMLQESDTVIANQEEVLKHYEDLLDDAVVRFPCNCGKNMFEGIFKPKGSYVVECEFCKNKYNIDLKLETALITEPIEDLNIDKLIRENTNDNN